MVLPLWAGLGLALYLLHIPPEYRICVFGFNPRVPFCSGTNFKTWFMYLLVLITKAILYLGAVRYALPPGVIAIFMPVSYFLFKNRVQVIAGVRAHWKGTFNLWGRLLTLWIFVKCAWCVPVIAGPQIAIYNPIKVCYRS